MPKRPPRDPFHIPLPTKPTPPERPILVTGSFAAHCHAVATIQLIERLRTLRPR